MNKPQISGIGRRAAKLLGILLLLPAFGAVPTGAGFSILPQRREEEEALEASSEVVEAAPEAPEAAPAAESEESSEGEEASEPATGASREPSSSSSFTAAPVSTARGSRSGSRGRRHHPGRLAPRAIALAAVAMLLLAGSAQASPDKWSDDVRLPNNTSGSVFAAIAVNGSNLHVAWRDTRDGNNEIYYKNSTDNGANWSADTRLTNNASDSDNPAIAVNQSKIHVVWTDNRDGNYEIYYKNSTDGGFTWSADTRLTNNASTSQSPAIAVVSNTTIQVVWIDSRDGANNEIYYKNSTDGGFTWSADTRLTNNASTSTAPDIAVNGTNLHVVWQDDRDGNFEIYYKNSTDGGFTWSADTRLTNDASSSQSPDIAVNQGNIHVVWRDNRDGNIEIYYKNSTNNGGVWSADMRLTYDAAASDKPAIAVNQSNIHVVWEDNRDGNVEIYYNTSADNGATWGTDTRLTNNASSSTTPTIAVGQGLHVAWEDNRDGNYLVYYKRSPGPVPAITSWSNNVTNDNSVSITADLNVSIIFNATASQGGTWTWKKDGTADQTNGSTNVSANYTTNFSTAGSHNVSVNISNSNGTSSTLLWTVTVNPGPPPPDPYTVWGNILNETGGSAGADTNVTVNVTNATKLAAGDINVTCSLNATTAADGSYTVDLANCGAGKYFRGDWLNVSALNKSRGAYGEAQGNVTTNTSINDTRINVTWSLKPLWRNQGQDRLTVGYQQTINLSAQGVDGRNLSNAVLYTNETGGFAPSGSVQAALGGNVSNDLSNADPGDWLGVSGVNDLVYNPLNKTIYVGANIGKFGVFYLSNDTLKDLSATDTFDWLGANAVNALAHDSVNNNIYLGAANGMFGVYNSSTNVTTNLSVTATWLSPTDNVNALAYNSVNQTIYLGATSGKFGIYYISNNTSVDLSTTDAGNWLGVSPVQTLAYDSANNRVYLGADSGLLGVHHIFNNTTEDLSATDAGNWLGTDPVSALAYDTASGRIYLGGGTGKFGFYSAGVTTDLSATDTGDWLGSSPLSSLAYDSPSRLIYIGAASGKFGVYNAVANIAINLSATDTGNWLGSNNVNALATARSIDATQIPLVFLGADSGKFGNYQRTGVFSFSQPNNGTWLWSNFSWQSDVTPSSTTVGWYINFTDEDGNWNNTTVLTFRVVPAITNWSNNITAGTLNFSVELAPNNAIYTVINFTINASEAVNWSWYVNGALSRGGISSPAAAVDSLVWQFNFTGNHTVEVNGTNNVTNDFTETKKWDVEVRDTTAPLVNNTTAMLYPGEVVQGGNVNFSIRIVDLGNVTNVLFRINNSTKTPNPANFSQNLTASLVSGTSKDGTWNATLVTTGFETGFYNWSYIYAKDAWNSTGNWNNTTQVNLPFWVVVQRNITFFPTRNLFALPVDRVPIDGASPTAEQTCTGAPTNMISDFKRVQQTWNSHMCGILANNYVLAGLTGYWASAPGASVSGTNVTKQGFDLPGVNQSIEAKWNLVGVRNTTSAGQACASIGPAAVAVARHNTSSNGYETHLCGLQANNFTMAVNAGYWVYVNNQVYWTQ